MLAAHHAEGGGAALADADHVHLPEAAPEVELILNRPGRQIHDQRATGTIIVHLEAAGVAFLARDAALPKAGAGHDTQQAQGVASPVSAEARVDRAGDAERLADEIGNALELEDKQYNYYQVVLLLIEVLGPATKPAANQPGTK